MNTNNLYGYKYAVHLMSGHMSVLIRTYCTCHYKVEIE